MLQDGGFSTIKKATVQRYQSMVWKEIRSTSQKVGTSLFCAKMLFQVQNVSELSCWNLMLQNLRRLLLKKSQEIFNFYQKARFKKQLDCYSQRTNIFSTKTARSSVSCLYELLQSFLVDHFISKWFSVPTFSGSFRDFWKGIPSGWQCLMVPWTRGLSYHFIQWNLQSVWSSIESEPTQWFKIFLALKLKWVRSRGYEIYMNKAIKKERKRSPK